MDNTFMILAEEAAKQLPAGAFLLTGDKPNPMTIGWAQFGIVWGKPICTVFVRKSRCSHELIENGDTFTVSIPKLGEMKEALALCGSKSGRDMDKLAAGNLSTMPSRTGGTPALAGCEIHFECKKLFSADGADLSRLTDPAVTERFYGKGDPHDIYFGEIVAAYKA